MTNLPGSWAAPYWKLQGILGKQKQQDGVVARTRRMTGWLFEFSFLFNQEEKNVVSVQSCV